MVVGRQDRGDLREALRSLLNAGQRIQLGRQAWLTALARHDAKTVRERFRRTLVDAARTRPPGGER